MADWDEKIIIAVSVAGAAVLAGAGLLLYMVSNANKAIDKELTDTLKQQKRWQKAHGGSPQRPLLYPSMSPTLQRAVPPEALHISQVQPPPPPVIPEADTAPPPPAYYSSRQPAPSFAKPAPPPEQPAAPPPLPSLPAADPRSASPTGLARDDNWGGGLHLQLICVKRHPDCAKGSIIPSVLGLKAKAVNSNDEQIGREVSWPCVETVPPSTSYVWDTTRYMQADIAATAAMRFTLVLPNNDGLTLYGRGCALMSDLVSEYPWEFDVETNDGMWFVVSVGLLSSPDLKKRVILWKCPADLPHEPESLLPEEVELLSEVYQTLQERLPLTGLCQGRTIFAGATVAGVQLAMCYLAPLLRWGDVEGFNNKAVVSRYAHEGSRFGMNAEEFVRRLKTATDESFEGIPGVREYLADEGCMLDTTSLLSKSPRLEPDPNIVDALGSFDDVSEFFNQIAYTPGVVLAVLTASGAYEFLNRYMSPSIPDAERSHHLTSPAFTVTELELDMSRGFPIVALKPIVGAHVVPDLRSGRFVAPPPPVPKPIPPSPPTRQMQVHPAPSGPVPPLVDRAQPLRRVPSAGPLTRTQSPVVPAQDVPDAPLGESKRLSPVPSRAHMKRTLHRGDGVVVFQPPAQALPPPERAAPELYTPPTVPAFDPREQEMQRREDDLKRREAELGGRETALLLRNKGAPTAAERAARRPPLISFDDFARRI